MNSLSLRTTLTSLGCLVLLFLVTGCFETKQEFTLNPDGSGKVIHESKFQNLNFSNEDTKPEDALKEAAGKVIEAAKGVETWRDVSFKRMDDGRFYFKGTAYFKSLSAFNIPNQTMLEFDWKTSADSCVLTLRTNKSEPKNGLSFERKEIDWARLSKEEHATKLKEERGKFLQMKPMLEGIIGSAKHEVILHLPGKLQEASNLRSGPGGTQQILFEGTKLLAALDKLINDDATVTKYIGNVGGKEKPVLDDTVNGLVFGQPAPVRATVTKGSPLFDYAAEVAAAKKEYAKVQKELGLSPVSVAPAADGGPVKSMKVVGVRLITETDKKREIRPFNYDAGYTLALLGELPGSALSVSDESALETAIADDGSDLLPKSEWSRKFHFPNLTADKSGVMLEAQLLVPGPKVKALKELSGRLQYSVASATKEVELGFEQLQVGAKGTELGAEIKSIKEGWAKDGSQEMEIKLKISRDLLKAIYLVEGSEKVELTRRGYSGGGNSFTFTYAAKKAFPGKGRLVAEVYDGLQTFNTKFKLENISLLGMPLDGK